MQVQRLRRDYAGRNNDNEGYLGRGFDDGYDGVYDGVYDGYHGRPVYDDYAYYGGTGSYNIVYNDRYPSVRTPVEYDAGYGVRGGLNGRRNAYPNTGTYPTLLDSPPIYGNPEYSPAFNDPSNRYPPDHHSDGRGYSDRYAGAEYGYRYDYLYGYDYGYMDEYAAPVATNGAYPHRGAGTGSRATGAHRRDAVLEGFYDGFPGTDFSGISLGPLRSSPDPSVVPLSSARTPPSSNHPAGPPGTVVTAASSLASAVGTARTPGPRPLDSTAARSGAGSAPWDNAGSNSFPGGEFPNSGFSGPIHAPAVSSATPWPATGNDVMSTGTITSSLPLDTATLPALTADTDVELLSIAGLANVLRQGNERVLARAEHTQVDGNLAPLRPAVERPAVERLAVERPVRDLLPVPVDAPIPGPGQPEPDRAEITVSGVGLSPVEAGGGGEVGVALDERM